MPLCRSHILKTRRLRDRGHPPRWSPRTDSAGARIKGGRQVCLLVRRATPHGDGLSGDRIRQLRETAGIVCRHRHPYRFEDAVWQSDMTLQLLADDYSGTCPYRSFSKLTRRPAVSNISKGLGWASQPTIWIYRSFRPKASPWPSPGRHYLPNCAAGTRRRLIDPLRYISRGKFLISRTSLRA